MISNVAFIVVGSNLIVGILFVFYWLFIGHPTLNIKDISIYSNPEYNFFIDCNISISYLQEKKRKFDSSCIGAIQIIPDTFWQFSAPSPAPLPCDIFEIAIFKYLYALN